MKPDIESREDLEKIISEFYEKLIQDEMMFPFFEEIVEGNHLKHHLSIIVDFWQDILFQTYQYKNNPMQKHLDFRQKVKFEKKHFVRWLQYLAEVVDEHFEGIKSLEMKTRATSIATVMQLKMNLYND